MMMKLLFAICLLSPFTSFSQVPNDYTRKLDSIFNDWNGSTPGGVAAIVHKGEVIFKKGFGLSDLKKKTNNSPALRYELASNAKQFTAMCIALLEEQGRLSIEDPLTKYYPKLKIRQEIKIKNLLDHSSGLRDASVLAILSGKMNLKGGVRKKYDTKAYYLECMMRETDLNFEPGSELAYTNFNYVLLGDIVEKVSGMTLASFADSAIFQPLGMNRTLIRDGHVKKVPDEASGYLFTGKKYKKRVAVEGIIGDHNLVSSIDDVIKWEMNFRNNQLGKRDPKLIEKFFTSSRLTNGDTSKYGYGVWIMNYKGVKVIGHGGDDGRHTSTLKFFPEQDLIVIVLANSSRYGDTEKKALATAEIFLKGQVSATPSKESETFITLTEEEWKSHAGLYTLIDKRGLAHIAKLTFVDGALYGSPNYYWQGLKLSALTQEYFIAKNTEGEMIHFRMSKEGDQKKVTTTYNEHTHTFTLHKESNVPVPFKDYKGSFENASTGATIKIKQKGDKIVGRKSILKIPLIPFGKDQFFAPEHQALFIFQRDGNGKVVSFKANSSDFRNFVFTKKNN